MARSAEPEAVLAGSIPAVVRFGVFELDVRARELRKGGLKVRLPDQPFQVLALLLEQPGDLVTREALQQRLWPAETFVEFDLSLNSAVRKLREALGDSADCPTFIETLPRRGYRFIAPVERPPVANGIPTVPDTRAVRVVSRPRLWWSVAALLAIVAAAAMVPGSNKPTPPSSPSPQTRAVSPEANDLFQRGLVAQGGSLAGNLAAISYFQQAIDKQPDFAPAYARLGVTWMQFLFGGTMPPAEVLPKAEKAARRALALDDNLKDAYRVLATVLRASGDHAGADASVNRLVNSWPDAESFTAQSLSFIVRHRFPEAVAAAERAVTLDERSENARKMLARAHRAAGDHTRAIAEFQRVSTLGNSGEVRFQLGATFVLSEDLKMAIPTLEKALERSYQSQRFRAYLGYAYALDGRTGEARQILQLLKETRRTQYVSSFGIALLHDALGEKEAALEALDRAVRDRAIELSIQLDAYPKFKTLASEPLYQELMRPPR